MGEGLKQWFARWIERAQATDIKSSRSRTILLYLCFVVISAILWCFLTFNNVITVDVQVPVTITSKPDNVRFLSKLPDTLTVTVSNRGSSFVKYIFKSVPAIELKFSDYADGDGLFKVDSPQLRKLINRQLGRGFNLSSVLPDGINVRYTDSQGKRVPVVVDIDAKPQLQYAQTGPLIQSVETVMVYAEPSTLEDITQVYTYHIKAHELTDTFRRKVSIAPLRGAVVEPRSLEVMVPVEKMTSQRQKLQIVVRNVPQDTKVIVFPSSVEAAYRAPVSALKRESEVRAIVDYNDIVASHSSKVAVRADEYPAIYQDVKLSVDSVEYIVEKQRQP